MEKNNVAFNKLFEISKTNFDLAKRIAERYPIDKFYLRELIQKQTGTKEERFISSLLALRIPCKDIDLSIIFRFFDVGDPKVYELCEILCDRIDVDVLDCKMLLMSQRIGGKVNEISVKLANKIPAETLVFKILLEFYVVEDCNSMSNLALMLCEKMPAENLEYKLLLKMHKSNNLRESNLASWLLLTKFADILDFETLKSISNFVDMNINLLAKELMIKNFPDQLDYETLLDFRSQGRSGVWKPAHDMLKKMNKEDVLEAEAALFFKRHKLQAQV